MGDSHVSVVGERRLMRYLNLKLIFPHIPKTAGTSFRGWLRRAFGADQVFWHGETGTIGDATIDELERYKVIGGHFHAPNGKIRSLEEKAGKENIIYVCIVREPLRRVASHFAYVTQRPHHPEYTELSLDDAIASGARCFERQKNIQCAFFSYGRTFDDVMKWSQPRKTLFSTIDDLDDLCQRLAIEFSLDNPGVQRANKAVVDYESILSSASLRTYVDTHCVEDKKLYSYVASRNLLP